MTFSTDEAHPLLQCPATFSVDPTSQGLDPALTLVAPNHVFADRASAAQQVTAYLSSGAAPGGAPDISNARSLVGVLGATNPPSFVAGDAIESLSFGRDGTVSPINPCCTPGPGTLYFSVTRGSLGVACTDVNRSATRPVPEAAADVYASFAPAFGRYPGPVALPLLPFDNYLAADFTELGLRPMLADAAEDELDSLELSVFNPVDPGRDFAYATLEAVTVSVRGALVDPRKRGPLRPIAIY